MNVLKSDSILGLFRFCLICCILVISANCSGGSGSGNEENPLETERIHLTLILNTTLEDTTMTLDLGDFDHFEDGSPYIFLIENAIVTADPQYPEVQVALDSNGDTLPSGHDITFLIIIDTGNIALTLHLNGVEHLQDNQAYEIILDDVQISTEPQYPSYSVISV